MIRVLLVEDHTAIRQPMAFMLDREPDLAVVGQAATLAEARGLLEGVDLAILDLDLPDGSGLSLIPALHRVNPNAVALVLTASSNRVTTARAVEAGAAGVIHKSQGLDEVISAVRRAAAGNFLYSPRELVELLRVAGADRDERRAAEAALGRLTPREREVLQALAEGLNDKEIAERLQIEPKTVRTHMMNLLSKLGVDSRLEALVFAVRHGAVRIR